MTNYLIISDIILIIIDYLCVIFYNYSSIVNRNIMYVLSNLSLYTITY